MANVKNNAAAQETKRRLIEAAGEVFAELGYERATIKDITERAGVALAAVNYHFSDKQELYYQVLRHVYEEGVETLRALREVARSPERPAEERFRELIGKLLRGALDPTKPDWHCDIKRREMQQPSDATDRFISDTLKPFSLALEQLIAELAGRQQTRRELVRHVHSVLGQCFFHAHFQPLYQRLYPDLPPATDRIDELTDHIACVSLAGIRCHDEPTPRTPARTRRTNSRPHKSSVNGSHK
ncbi:MAG: CerR family C-terminal domain-containing protein [Tepidisphaeraceae bacterium]